ncbi:MAG: alginate export family protein [Akkermansiaceae bacterium]
MLKKIAATVVYSGILIHSAQAGEHEAISVTPEKGPDFIKFFANARLRYEARNEQGFDASHAVTLRLRPGFELFPDEALSFYVESENTLALVDDYQVGTPQSANFTPFEANNTVISDPETNEINQVFLKYSNDNFTGKVGRQRIILDSAAFIGNVGWRQNEQTYDAVSLNYKQSDFNVFYAYANQVNRIFGVDGSGAVQALEGDVHLLNASLAKGDDKFGGYAYLMDFSDQGAGFPVNASNNTYGVYTDLKKSSGMYHLEFAYQTEAGSKADYDALYGAASFIKKVGSVSFTAGVEHLGDGFVTPLATVHAYNGFADAFIGNRLGLADSWDGLNDIYLKAVTKVADDIVLKGSLHHFRDDSLSSSYGWEADLVAVKPINENTKIIGKFAYFMGDDDSVFQNDISQFSLQLDYSF